MLTLGALGFASPWILLAGLGLPVIWWLLRVTPPAPALINFPAARLLLALRSREEQPARTPLWLIILRILLAALIILALAQPIFNPNAALRGSGPLVLVIDNGWAAAANWQDRRRAWETLIDQADREDRPVHLVATARTERNKAIEFSDLLRPGEAREILRTIRPLPWASDYAAVVAATDALRIDGSAHVTWLSDGTGSEQAAALAGRLQSLGNLEILTDSPDRIARLVDPPKADSGGLDVSVRRAGGAGRSSSRIRAVAPDGRMLARGEAVFEDGKQGAMVRLALPGPLRNAVARIEIENQDSAGAVFLLDERWRRRPVGMVSGGSIEADQPLLSAIHYLERALRPFSDVSRGSIAELLEQPLAVMVLADIGKLGTGQTDRLTRWIERGGVAVRFAGPKLAQGADTLLPVKLRSGGRALGGALSWTKPARLIPFAETSPFFGLEVPGDIRVRRQVLAEPSLALNDKTWARLTDGTPLVTAERRGQGWLILVHTTANTDWSNLPISGLFVEMLRRIVDLSQGVVGHDPNAVLPPLVTLDGFGVLGDPPATATAMSAANIAQANIGKAQIGPRSPPGYYGSDTARRALNLAQAIEVFEPLGPMPAGVARAGYDRDPAVPLQHWLLLAALLLAIADTLIGLVMRGLVRLRPSQVTGAAVISLAAVLSGGPADAQAQAQAQSQARQRLPAGPDAKALLATLETRLAYVITGDRQVDGISQAGLAGLTRVLRRRTAVEPGEPLGVDIETDELAFFPLLYWAVSTRQRPPSDRALERLNQYLRSGGTILFDTRERGDFTTGSFAGAGGSARHLRTLLRGLDLPMLIPVPRDHVLTKAFYLLSDFPGRWIGGRVWVERRGGQHNDGVSPVVIGSNDWASAWAVDRFGVAMFPTVPGGERQRELAFRFGVNWVMYALTGNYKTDQVHVPAIIERLGQ